MFLAVIELEIVRVGYHAGEIHAGTELLGVAEADRQQFPLMHDGGGGVAGTEVDAEAHGEFRGDQGPRTLLQFAADCKFPQPLVPAQAGRRPRAKARGAGRLQWRLLIHFEVLADVFCPACPQCTLENTYADGALWICADCGFEWTAEESAGSTLVVRDSNGNTLQAGDTVTVIRT